MRPFLLACAALAPFVVGCVPVTQPLGDVEKSEPDKALVGKWTRTKISGVLADLSPQEMELGLHEAKGSPKGLMSERSDASGLFYTTKVGTSTYATFYIGPKNELDMPDFSKEGEFAKWAKKPGIRYFVCRYTVTGDALTVDWGNLEVFSKLMAAEKIVGDGEKHIEFFDTPAGWLAKYLDKNGPDKLFDGTSRAEYTREKKK